MTDPVSFRLHEDLVLFREAVNFTAAKTGFAARLVEKDYFSTVFLDYLTDSAGDRLVFKGGTCLAKVYAGFYRVSEDLDFTISLPVDTSRTQRRQAVVAVKDAVAGVGDHLSAFDVGQPLTGANNSTQYNGSVQYTSPTTGQPESILIEVSLREPLLTPTIQGQAKTILLDPINGEAIVPELLLTCISRNEAIAEKLRAALSRLGVAIRDFYDLHHAVENLGINPGNATLIDLVRQKLAVPGNPPVDVSPERLADLRRQMEARLRPVLRQQEYEQFDLDRAFGIAAEIAKKLA